MLFEIQPLSRIKYSYTHNRTHTPGDADVQFYSMSLRITVFLIQVICIPNLGYSSHVSCIISIEYMTFYIGMLLQRGLKHCFDQSCPDVQIIDISVVRDVQIIDISLLNVLIYYNVNIIFFGLRYHQEVIRVRMRKTIMMVVTVKNA